jgi:rhodanese-related sulfurtransferase
MPEPTEISPAEVKSRLDHGENFLLLDVRNPDEYETAHIEKARLLPMSELADKVAELAAWKNKPIVTYCHKGGRSLQVANWLATQGFTNVQSLAGGIDAWSTEVDPNVPRY